MPTRKSQFYSLVQSPQQVRCDQGGQIMFVGRANGRSELFAIFSSEQLMVIGPSLLLLASQPAHLPASPLSVRKLCRRNVEFQFEVYVCMCVSMCACVCVCMSDLWSAISYLPVVSTISLNNW